MSSVQRNYRIYFGLWLASIAVAAISLLWLGADARIPVDMLADGTVTKSRSTLVLWYMPAMITILYGVLPIAHWVDSLRWRGRTIELSEDARRGLGRYGRVFRNTMIGFGLLCIMLQLFTLARALGVAAPLGLDREGVVRVFFVVAGLLFAYSGNVTPKLPYVPNKGVDAAGHHRANRFVGWVFMLGGVTYSLIALILPFDDLTRIGGFVIAAMIVLPLVRYIWAGIAYQRRKRWEEHEGLV